MRNGAPKEQKEYLITLGDADAVVLFYGLRRESPENGSFIEIGQRLSEDLAEKVRTS